MKSLDEIKIFLNTVTSEIWCRCGCVIMITKEDENFYKCENCNLEWIYHHDTEEWELKNIIEEVYY